VAPRRPLLLGLPPDEVRYHHRVVPVTEGGEILEEISTGDKGVSACILGRDDGPTLYLCGAPHFDETEPSSTRLGKPVATNVAPHACTPSARHSARLQRIRTRALADRGCRYAHRQYGTWTPRLP
jgi:hypothetical protein